MDKTGSQKVNFRLLLDSIYTQEQLDKVKDDIRTISGMAFKVGSGSLSSQIKDKVGSRLYLYISSLEAEGRLPAAPVLGKFFSDINKFLTDLDKITLTMAFEPSLDFQKEVVLWLNKNLGKKVVAEFVVEEGIIGGLIIEYMGKYKDYSKASEVNMMLTLQ